MKRFKKAIALLLAAAVMISGGPFMVQAEQTPEHAPAAEVPADGLTFNTGSFAYRVVDEAKMEELTAKLPLEELGQYAVCDADGRCRIEVEQDAFFPYEVQFTYDGQTQSRWFMDSTDVITVGGCEFYLDAPVTGKAVTQISLNVAGDTVVVYPKAKQFTNDEDGQTQEQSLLPLEEKQFTADLSAYTPVELTKISFAAIFQGQNIPADNTYVMWKRRENLEETDYDYTVSPIGGTFNLNADYWEMIVGEKDQLAAGNVRYLIDTQRGYSGQWLVPSVYVENSAGRKDLSRSGYYSRSDSVLRVYYVKQDEGNYFAALRLNKEIFQNPKYASMRVFEGELTETELAGAKDITSLIWQEDISAQGSGYPVTMDQFYSNRQWVTLVCYDAAGTITGCLPVELNFFGNSDRNGIYGSLYENGLDAVRGYSIQPKENLTEFIYYMENGYPTDREYLLKLKYYADGEPVTRNDITAYVGEYATLEAANAAGAQDVAATLFGNGYNANFGNDGVAVTFFIGSGSAQERCCYRFRAEERISGTLGDVSIGELTEPDNQGILSYYTYPISADGVTTYTIALKRQHPVEGQYTLHFNYEKDYIYETSPGDEVKAYAGSYPSISEAQAAGAADIKSTLFSDGYTADYSKGVPFSIFVGADSHPEQKKYRFLVKTERYLSASTEVRFTGAVMKAEPENILVPAHTFFDSYGDHNFYTILVDNQAAGQAVDLTSLALTFEAGDGVKLYEAGTQDSTSLEISGESFHDFSQGTKQFSAASENGKDVANYFVRLIQAKSNQSQIYINSLDDERSKTETDAATGTVRTVREVMLDSFHENRHDIVTANIGTEALKALNVSLESEYLELDDYWTFHGAHDLAGFTTAEIDDAVNYGQLSNLAMLRLRAKEGITAGDYDLGTLTIKSGEQALMVITLSGVIGDPHIIREQVPNPTKYVPYGILIENNNKYSWNHPKYSLADGKLPDGMELMENGELYGVPKEAGEFEITVRMKNENSRTAFADSEKKYSFTVLDNTDENVVNAQDEGYELTKTIQGIYDTTNGNYYIVSKGFFNEFTELYIDSQKLTRDTDYWAEEGSTCLTIAAQSLPKSAGTHTIGVEFRKERSKGQVKAGAQNYTVRSNSSSGSSSGGSSGGGSIPAQRPAPAPAPKPDPTPAPAPQPTPVPQPVPAPEPVPEPEPVISRDIQHAITCTAKEGETLKSLAKKYYGKSSKWKKIYDANKDKLALENDLPAGIKLVIPAINYTVKKGDTIKSIAKKYLGSAAKWKRLYEINQDVLTSADNLKTGTKLIIPVPVFSTFYTVKSGDTLESLAKRYYGDSSKWERIYKENTNKISSSNKLKEGSTLYIPALTYTVKKGDTIKTIAKNYFGANGKWRLVYEANKDVIPASLKLKEKEQLVIQLPVCRTVHQVKSGDTLKSLAEKYYGNKGKWKKILKANESKISASNQVRAGRKLVIPALNQTAEKGDTLESLAKKYYGDKKKWPKIYRANQDVITPSKKLKTGISLVIPVPADSK